MLSTVIHVLLVLSKLFLPLERVFHHMTISQIWLLKVLGSVGHPIQHTEFKIVDSETDEVLPPGSKGIVKVRGPQVMKGYYKVIINWKVLLQEDNQWKFSACEECLQMFVWCSFYNMQPEYCTSFIYLFFTKKRKDKIKKF